MYIKTYKQYIYTEEATEMAAKYMQNKKLWF